MADDKCKTSSQLKVDHCRKLKFIPDKQFKELIEVGASPIRSDSEIDRDCRIVEYEDFLQSKGFEYKDTRLSSSGGVRSYDNKAINKKVEIMRSPDSSGIQYWVGKISNDKEISHGKGLDNLKKKI